MKNRVTMQEIGKAVGVSTVTVSKALAGKDGVSEAVRAKIIRTALSMGYPYAQPIRTDPVLIGIVTADRYFSSGSFYASLYKELVTELTAGHMLSLFEIIPEASEKRGILPTLLRERRVTGLLVLGRFDTSYVRLLTQAGVPAVLVDFYCSEIDTDAVVSDGQAGIFAITRSLVERGHRDIGFVGAVADGSTPETPYSSAMERLIGFRQAMLVSGLNVRPECLVEDRAEDGRYLPELRLPDVLPTAFVCENDEIAGRLIEQLRRLGKEVPEHLSVTGYDNFLFATLCRPQLTSYAVDQPRMARIAVQRLVSRIQGEKEARIRSVVSGWIVERDSVRPVHVMSRNA